MKPLGVLGGMGPAATTAFLQRLQALTPAARDEDHIRVLMDLNPQVPNRHQEPEAAGRVLGQMAARLRDMGAEVLAMPCNTAHAHADRIREAGLPFIDMVAATAGAAAASGARRIGVLATPGGELLYSAALERLGAQPVRLEGEARERFMRSVFGVKAGDVGGENREVMLGLARALVTAGAEALIAGCTEVPLLLTTAAAPAPLTDSTEVLAAACVQACAA